MPLPRPSVRCQRTILHFDYDCFYASVFEAHDPALKTVPLAVQQKQIVVTCIRMAYSLYLFPLEVLPLISKRQLSDLS